jgi:hypothetical protein
VKAAVFLILTATLVSGAVKPVATLISFGAVYFNGTRMWAQAVYAWPVLAGDEIASKETTATLLFPDKNRVTLYRDTRVKVDHRADKATLQLIQGRIEYALVPGSSLVFLLNNRPLDLPRSSGSISLVGSNVTFGTPLGLPEGELSAPVMLPRLGEYSAGQK